MTTLERGKDPEDDKAESSKMAVKKGTTFSRTVLG